MKKILFLVSILLFSCQDKSNEVDPKPTGIMWFNDSPSDRDIVIEGIRHFQHIEFEKAHVYFEKAVKLDSTLFAPHVMLASLSRPNSPQQEYHYNMAKELVKDKNENSKRFVSLLDRPNKNGNRTIFGRGDKSKVWDLMIADAPTGPFIQFYHAWSRNDLDNRIKTLENLREARVSEGEADNGHITNFLGYSYVQAEQLDKAKSAFEDYIAKNPERYNSYDSLGEFYLNQKDYENAKEYYQKALNTYPGANSARQKLMSINEMNSK